jgi:hypothetical protein
MGSKGVEPLRRIDRRAHANPAFVTAGIPGSVGSSVIDLWQGLVRCRRRIAVWPFDGDLKQLRRGSKPVLGEIYPRVAYGLALGERREAPGRRRVAVAKTRQSSRNAFLELLLSPEAWVARLGVVLQDVEEAKASEDAFDALVAAAGLLRCVLERTPLSDGRYEDSLAEGGILGSGGVCFDAPERSFPLEGRATDDAG